MFKQLFVKCTQQWEHNARLYGGTDMPMKQDQHLKYLVELTLEKWGWVLAVPALGN